MTHAILHVLGIDGSSYWANFWSGFGSGPLAWLGIPFVYYWHHICHSKRCYRIGHPDSGGIVKCKHHVSKETPVTDTYLLLDDVSVPLLERFAAPAHALAGYVNGRYANWSPIAARYGKSGKFLLSIDVLDKPKAGAQCLDIENGDATIADAPGWHKATQKAGQKSRDFRWFPKLYTSEGNLEALVAKMSAAGIPRGEYRIWSAHYTGKPHICGPDSCGSKVQADATQWTDKYQGVSLDASLCSAAFFDGPPAPEPAVPEPEPVRVPEAAAPGVSVPADVIAAAHVLSAWFESLAA